MENHLESGGVQPNYVGQCKDLPVPIWYNQTGGIHRGRDMYYWLYNH